MYKLSLFRVRRRIGLLLSTLGACWCGFTIAGFGQNYYTLGVFHRIGQCTDYSYYGVYSYKHEKKKYATQHY